MKADAHSKYLHCKRVRRWDLLSVFCNPVFFSKSASRIPQSHRVHAKAEGGRRKNVAQRYTCHSEKNWLKIYWNIHTRNPRDACTCYLLWSVRGVRPPPLWEWVFSQVKNDRQLVSTVSSVGRLPCGWPYPQQVADRRPDGGAAAFTSA